MFRGLRLRLTLVYLAAALALIVLVGVGTYLLLDRYFQRSTDLALQHKMATQFALLSLEVPPDLAAADREYLAGRGVAPTTRPAPTQRAERNDGDEERDEGDTGSEDDGSHSATEEEAAEATRERELLYDGELAAIYVLPLTADGQFVAAAALGGTAVVGASEAPAAPAAPDAGAAQAAMRTGHDIRTVVLAGGARARLLTYRLGAPGGNTTNLNTTAAPGEVALLQAGRTLADQDRVLGQLLLWLGVLSGISALALGAASWWLAGRSLRPAQAAWAKQQTFVANASHELRAPLTLMRAGAEVALRRAPKDDRDQRELLEDVLQECDHMNGLVEDLLLLSRLDAGRVEMKKERIDAAELLSDVKRQVGPLAGQRGIGVEVATDRHGGQGTEDEGVGAAKGSEAGLVVLGDRARLRQVLLALLDNALRHTPPGGEVRLRAFVQGSHIALEVEDSGTGIPPEHLPHVFERFYRAEGDRGEESSGSGLGLPIAKALVEAQGGRISLTSRVGQGTQARLLLPKA